MSLNGNNEIEYASVISKFKQDLHARRNMAVADIEGTHHLFWILQR